MKRLIIFALIVALLGFGGHTLADTPPTTENDISPQGWRPVSVIDGVEVPEEILLEVQMEHQGYAVVKALKTRRSGQTAYMLRLESGNRAQRAFYLLYDQAWVAIGREEVVPKPEPVPTEETAQPPLPVVEIPTNLPPAEEPDPVVEPTEPEPEQPSPPTIPRRRR